MTQLNLDLLDEYRSMSKSKKMFKSTVNSVIT